MSATVDLPDLNVWLALACPDHSHHRQALHYWEQQAAGQVLFCAVTALALLESGCMAGRCFTSCCVVASCRPVSAPMPTWRSARKALLGRRA